MHRNVQAWRRLLVGEGILEPSSTMDLIYEITIAPKLAAAFTLGSVIGPDREREGRSADICTHAAVSMGADFKCLP